MPRKGMRSIFFHPPKFSPSPSPSRNFSSTPSSPSTHRISFSDSMMEDNIINAEAIITKWDPDSSSYAKITSLFYENRREARNFLRAVSNLQSAMQFYVADSSSSSSPQKLVHCQHLMQTAIKRLEKEFYQILAANRDHLDPESVSARSSTATTRSSTSDYDYDTEDEILISAGASISEVERDASLAMVDLRSIVECMISSGYGKECVKIYKIIRKSIVDEGIYRLGFDRTGSNRHLHKLDWEVVEIKIKGWLHAIKVAVKTLFLGERILSDHVFSTSGPIKESCFSEIAKEAALALFGFAESVTKCKRSPEKLFRFLDMYNAISELWPDIETIFSYESTSAVRSQAVASLIKLGEAVRDTFANFESAIQKDSSRSPVPGGGVHPLTKYVMNYVCFLGDYSGILSDIFADYPLEIRSPLPDSLLQNSPTAENPLSSIATRIEWLILVLLCKLDGKAERYKDVSLSYMFLANNLQYVVSKIRSSDLSLLLGEEWVTKHESKVRLYAANYERMAWNKVIQTIPPNPTAEIPLDEAREAFRRFNSAFESAYRTQASWVVSDAKLKDEIKVSIARKIVPPYRAFYEKYRVRLQSETSLDVLVRFAPEDLENHLSDLFYGSGSVSGSVSVSVSVRPASVRSQGSNSSSRCYG
ncbi:exocyst complex component EXO70B1-like protein [Cinnamomum micranthum f. kanehirae]|uniref:Exocyst subunit Exo70 family protein n=1 Tax=Cinnamomum micranthum f. kanehirae TaxID=337451 RepID=A0A443NEA6_9MAGN|nr:exocyst complex component EXO70B1-like protein [Cinnamomum micranthum f. kanehirae]